MNRNSRVFRPLVAASAVCLLLGSGATALAATNLIVNNADLNTASGTSTSTPAGWQTGGFGTNLFEMDYPSQGASGLSGDSAATVKITSYTDGDRKWYFDEVPVTPGTLYTFSDSYKATVPTQIVAQYHTTSTTTPFVYTVPIAVPASANWTTFTTGLPPAPADATHVTIFHLLNNVGELTVDNFSLTVNENVFSHGIVTLTFDDGWMSQHTNALPILYNGGVNSMPASFYIISNAMSDPDSGNHGPDGYMTTAEVLDLQAKGFEVSAHTKDHCDLVKLYNDPSSATLPGTSGPPSQACAYQLSASSTSESQIADSRQALLDVGITPSDTFVYPYGSFNTQVEQQVQAAGYRGSRTTLDGYNDKNTDRYALVNKIIDKALTESPTGLQDVKTWIDTALQNHTWLIFTLHQVEDPSITSGDDGATTKAFLQQVVDYLRSKNADVKTMHDMLASSEFNPPPSTTQTLTVNLNISGGSATPSDFKLTVTNGGSTIAGNVTASTTQTYTVTSGLSFSVAEQLTASSTNYSQTLTGDCSGTVAAIPLTCTITNTYNPPAPTNQAPVVTAPANASGTASSAMGFTVNISDPDADPLTITSSLPSGATFNTTTGAFAWTPSEATTTQASFSAFDGTATTTATVAITVVPASTPTPTPTPAPSGGGGGGGGGGGPTVTTGTVTGSLYTDANRNGSKDSGESMLPGWTVYLDINNNSQLDAGELSTVSDTYGNYYISNIPLGQYTLREVPASGWSQVAPASGNGYSISVSSVLYFYTNQNFGNVQGQVLGETTTKPNPTPTQTPPTVPGGSIGMCQAILTKDMYYGYSRFFNKPDSVKALQNFLNVTIGTKIPQTGYYGTMTRAAVISFQKKHLKELGLKRANGNMTGKTRELINRMLCPQ